MLNKLLRFIKVDLNFYMVLSYSVSVSKNLATSAMNELCNDVKAIATDACDPLVYNNPIVPGPTLMFIPSLTLSSRTVKKYISILNQKLIFSELFGLKKLEPHVNTL
jgi:hypothetical protein